MHPRLLGVASRHGEYFMVGWRRSGARPSEPPVAKGIGSVHPFRPAVAPVARIASRSGLEDGSTLMTRCACASGVPLDLVGFPRRVVAHLGP